MRDHSTGEELSVPELSKPGSLRGVHEPVDALDTIRWEEYHPPGAGRAPEGDPSSQRARMNSTSHPAVTQKAAPPPPPVTRRAAPPPPPPAARRTGSVPVVPAAARRTGSVPAVFPYYVLTEADLPALEDEPPVEGEDALAVLLGGMQASERRKERAPNPNTAWFEEIFDESWLQLRPENDSHRSLREAEFLVNELGSKSGSVLDVGCGQGRHLVPLAKAGYQVTGVDLSRPLLRRAWGQAQRERVRENVTLWHGDMRKIANARSAFDLVYCWESTFGYFEDRSNFELLNSLKEVTKLGGTLVIEVLNRDWVLGELPRKFWWERNDLLVLEDVTFDLRRSRLMVERTIVDDNEDQWKQKYSLRLYSLHELSGMLALAGFEVVRVSGHIASRGAYFATHSRSVIVTARRVK